MSSRSELSGRLDHPEPNPSPEPVIPGADPRAARFVIRLAQALHAHGTPAHRLERELERLARALELEAQFFSTPTSIQLAFGPPHAQQVALLRVDSGDADLGKLVRFQEIIEGVDSRTLDLEDAERRLTGIMKAPPLIGSAGIAVAFGVASACATRLFGGSAVDCVATLSIGTLVGALASWLPRQRNAVGLFEPLAAFFAALLAYAGGHVVPLSPELVTLGSLIVLMPGLTLTLALTELTTRHLVSGTARFSGALTTFLGIGFGVAIGRVLVLRTVGPPALEPLEPMPAWTEIVALLVAPIAFSTLFQVRPRELPLIVATGGLSVLGSRLGAMGLGPELGAFLGALLVGLSAQAYARITNRPSLVLLLPGILLLVPGSIGFRSITSFLAADVTTGMETAFRMTLVAVSLVGGILTASAILPPRREL